MAKSQDCSFLPPRILTRGISLKLLLTVFVVLYTTLISSYKSEAQTDLNGVDTTLTATSAFSTSYTNSSDTLAKLTVQLGITSSTDFSGQLTGNLQFVVHLDTNQDNGSRLYLKNTNNTFTGGVLIDQGTLRADNYGVLGTSKQIDINHACLMTNKSFEGYTFNLIGDASTGKRGAIRLSGGNGNFDAYITGPGSFEIVNDGAMTLTNTENDYQGKTYIGNFQWRKNSNKDQNLAGTLNLGDSGVLPDTTVVVFGSGYGGNNDSIKSITLDLKGFNETIAGIYSTNTKAVIQSTNAENAATLTLKTLSGSSESYAGKITGNVNLEITGLGTQTLSGANTYTGTTKISAGTLNLSGEGCTLGSGALTIESSGVLLLTNAYQGLKNVSSLSGNGEIRSASGYNYLNVTSSEPQSYSGTINVPESYRIDIGYNDGTNHSTDVSLPNATVSLNGSGSILGLVHGTNSNDSTSFTIGTLNGVAGSFVRLSGNTSNVAGFSTLTVGQGEFAGTIGGENANQSKLSLVKNTSGTLTLSGANTYSGETTVSEGTLKLTDAAVVANSLMTVGANGTLEYNLANNQTERLTIEDTNAILSTGTIKKTGDGTLKLFAADEDLINSYSFVVSSGRLDMTKYFKGALTVGEKLDPENYLTAIFSPGNSVGSLDITGDFTLNPGSTLLLEFDETGADSLLVSGTTKFEEGSIITLTLDEGASLSPNQQVSFQLPANIASFDNAALSYPSYLVGIGYDPTTGVLSATVDANAVPEPSTWALLLLGAAGLLYVRKRKN